MSKISIAKGDINTSKSGSKNNTTEENKQVYKFKTKELSFNCRQLSAMLSSGLTLVKALDILSKEQENEKATRYGSISMNRFRKVNRFQTLLRCREMHSLGS